MARGDEQERDNNWSDFSSSRDPLPSAASQLIPLKSFTIRTKQFLHLVPPDRFSFLKFITMKQFRLESETVTKELPLISGKTPWGGMGDSHPRKPTGHHGMTPWGGKGLKYSTIIYQQMWDQVWRHSRHWEWMAVHMKLSWASFKDHGTFRLPSQETYRALVWPHGEGRA